MNVGQLEYFEFKYFGGATVGVMAREGEERAEFRDGGEENEPLAALKIRLEMQKNAILMGEQEDRRKEQDDRRKEQDDRRREREEEFRNREREHEIRMAEMRGQEPRASGDIAERWGGNSEKIRIPKIEDNCNPQDILAAFEKVCKLHDIPKASWVAKLLPSLCGKSLRAYSQVPDEEGSNYDLVKIEIMKAFGLTPDEYRKKFRAVTKRNNETYFQMVTRLSDFFDEWAKGSGVNDDYCKLRELIIKEQFKEIIPTDLQIWLADRDLTGPQEIAMAADRYEEARKERKPDRRDKGPQRFEPRHVRRNTAPRREVVTPRQINSGRSIEEGRRPEVRCYKCNLRGHFANECVTNAPSKEQSSTQIKKLYFVALDRAKLPAEYTRKVLINGRTVEALRDTGAFISIVDKDLVEKGQLTGEYVDLATVANEIVRVPTADVKWHIDGRDENVTVAVLPNLPVSFIAGNAEGEILRVRQKATSENANTEGETGKKMNARTVGNYEVCPLIDGRYVRALRDTGASLSLIREEIVQPKQYTGDRVEIQTVTGKRLSVPLVRVKVELDGQVREVTMGVAGNHLPYQMLLGNDVGPIMSPIWNCVVIADTVKDRQGTEEEKRKPSQEGVREVRRSTKLQRQRKTQERRRSLVKAPTAKEGNRAERTRPIRRARTRGSSSIKDANETPSEIKHSNDADVIEYESGDDKGGGMPADMVNCLEMVTTREDFIRLQQADESLKSIRQKVDNDSIELGIEDAKFLMKDGMLMRRWRSHKRHQTWEQLVIPEKLRRPLMHLAHHSLLAAHMGITKTRDRLLQSVYWPGIFAEVAEYVKSCATCQFTSKPGAGMKAPLHPVPAIEEPFFKLGMDLIGPLRATDRGSKYILTVVDYASRYPEAEPLESIEASTVVEALVKMFTRTGFPSEIVSDQGTQFMAAITQGLWHRAGVRINRTTPFHPASNGAVERINGTLKAMLRTLVEEYKEDWDRLIPYALFAYREVPNESTGFSPFELIYGRNVRGPVELLRRSWTREENEKQAVTTYLKELRTKMSRTARIAVKNLKAAQTNQKAWYDKTARKRNLEVGTHALVLRPIKGEALDVAWDGPFKITRKVGELNYEVELASGERKIYHINMLKSFKKRPILVGFAGDAENPEEDEESHEGMTFPVGEIKSTQPQMGPDLTNQQRTELEEMLRQFKSVLRDSPGRTHLETHKIELTDTTPICVKQYRNPWAVRSEIERQVSDMMRLGIIEESRSNYSSPVVLVPKKTGEARFCVDFRKLNKLTRLDPFPAPHLEDSIAGLGRAKFLTKIDLVRGYWQIPLEPLTKEKTAFRTESGLYQFTVLPFGLKNSSAAFTRLMGKVLEGLEPYTKCYIDDVLVHSTNWADHKQHIAAVLERLKEAGLTARPGKCNFGMNSVGYLGHEVGPAGITPDEAKVKAIGNWPRPTTKKQVRAFLGVTGYYRKYIQSYASIAAALTELTKKSEPNRIKWTEECEEAFQMLKSRLMTRPVLKSADEEGQFIVQTDASDKGLGVVLSQTCPNTGEEHPVAYLSRKLTTAELSYSTIERECLCIVWGVEKARNFLYARKFIVETDHNPLTFLDRMRDKNRKILRWTLILQDYDFEIRYKRGKTHSNADGLSRQ